MKNTEKLNAQRRTTKALKYAGLTFGLGTIVTGTATVIASCATDDPSTFTYFSATDFLQSQNNPLNPTFSNSPIDLYSNSSMAGLLTYETTGQFKFNSESGQREESPKDNLKLEGATKLTGYGKDGTVIGTIERSSKPITEHEKYAEITSKATKYEFTIDTNFKWVDKNGNVQQNLSGKDFERGLETYVLGSALGYQRNGYFIELVGLDLKKTLGDDVVNITEASYDIDSFKNTDDKYTLELEEPYPYFLSVLTKAYFLPVPHTNQYVKAIKMAADPNTGPIIWTQKDDKKKVMNPGATRFNELYGSGTNNFLDRSWFLGPYYINHFTTSQIVSLFNPYYFDNMKGTLDSGNGNKIRKVIYNYGSGNPEVFYNRFLSNQSSWIDAVPTSRRSEAQRKYSKSGELYLSGVSQISKSNYAAYTPVPYVVEGEQVKENDNVSEAAAKTIFNFQSKQSTIFRAALAGLINHVDLAKLVTNSGDLQFSSIPFGVFQFNTDLSSKLGASEYYQAVAKGNVQGGFPRPLSEYTRDKFGDDYVDDSEIGFKVPYYTYNGTGTAAENAQANGKYTKEELQVSKKTFIEALKASGATGSAPAVWQYKYPDRSPSTEYQNYLNRLKAAIEALGTEGSIKYITFNLVPGGATTPSNSDWFNNRSSSMGYSGWSPDYNAVGTWHEANGMLNSDSSAATNTYSIFPGLFKYMIISAKDRNATVNSNGATYQKQPETTASVFDADSRIPKGIWTGSQFAQKGVDFLNYLITSKVLDGSKISTLLSTPNDIKALDQNGNATANNGSTNANGTLTKPSNKNDLTPLSKYFVTNGGAANFNKYLGVWAGQSDENALWLTVVADTQNIYIPRAEAGLNETIFSLVNKNFKVRKSGAGEINLRDFEYLGK